MSKQIKEFFNQWNIYKKVIKHNYMFHIEIFQKLQYFLNQHQHQNLLDLGCGDAYHIARILKNSHITNYYGIDLSEIALQEAQQNFATINCDKQFIQTNLIDFIATQQAKFDIIIAGYSIHHLTLTEKDNFFAQATIALKPGGSLLIYDLVRCEDETQSDYLDRWWKYCLNNWKAMTSEELSLIKYHIYNNDYPETFAIFNKIAIKQQYKKVESLYKDDFYELYRFSL
ncbi:class I SAM-dependent methyltransferase [Candidatus Marithrix sp. Canyon 246]|uniref:class I SAM-dependent methyltransferase n=1 Tax=Candidatus Marithrix sp. Canyon 246 TaxID=1827136 RepID=UPI000849F1D2|nr:class I SAM-dependent methyltransferase [Candidatus Marithrix sp. Canyon 246]